MAMPVSVSLGQSEAVTNPEDDDEGNVDVESLVPGRRFKILSEFEESNDEFKVRIRKLKIQMVPEYREDPMKWLESTFRDIHTYATSSFREDDRVRISFEMENFDVDVEPSPFRPMSEWDGNDLWELISNSTRNAVQFDVNKPFLVIIQCVQMPEDTASGDSTWEEEDDRRQMSSDECPRCLTKPTCKSKSTDLECPNCRRVFSGEECMRKHRETGSFGQGKTVCEMLRNCENCAQMIDRSIEEDHSCKTRFCETCNCKRPFKHLCFMARREPKDPSTNYIFIFYDFEPQQKRQIFGKNSDDLPQRCVVQQVCTKCLSLPEIPETCQFCGPTGEVTFETNPAQELVKFATRNVGDGWYIICIAYNASDWNTRLILPHLGKRSTKPPQLTSKHNIVDRFKTGYANFVDSQRFIPLSFSTLSEAFKLWEDKSPDKDRSSVDILRRATIGFRKMFLECCEMCPFTESQTIATTSVEVFRKNYLQPDTIAILPPNGYKYNGRYSQKAIEWLDRKERILGVAFRRDENGSREFIIPEIGRSVDGYYEAGGKRHVFEFHNCYWHGCPCMSTYFPLTEREIDKRRQETRFKTARLKELGYVVEEIRECKFVTEMQQESPDSEPLQPRDALYTGRVENISRYYRIPSEAKDDGQEKIRNLDVCSLYPSIYKYGKFPVGHPKVYVGDECEELTGASGDDISRVEGLIKCCVLPPRNLYFPVLPIRMYGEQMYPLCRSCCETFEQNNCPHDDDTKRQFEGTWVSDELKKAVKKGYKIVNVVEIWQYHRIEEFNRSTGQGGLFVNYTNTFFKIKQEASGCPIGISAEEYVSSHKKKERIQLDPDRVIKNPGLRLTAKKCLNVFWGKLGQRENLPKVRNVETRQDLLRLLSDPEITVTDLLPVNDQLLYAAWSSTKGKVIPLKTANVVIAAYVTAQARLKLYDYLEQLDRQVLYCNTDSVIYVQRTNSPADEFETGHLLGEMTDELASYGQNSYIRAFVSIGPKTFAYIVRLPDGNDIEVCKVKGITLNHSKIDFESLRKTLVDGEDPIQLEYHPLCRTMSQDESTLGEANTNKLIFKRRRFADKFGTLPYGYRAENN